MMSALGIIEFIGIVPAITAGDAAAKAANIEILGMEKTDGGLVTIKMRGNVAAVEAALNAAEEAGRPFGTFLGKTLIARPSEDTFTAFGKQEEPKTSVKSNKEAEVQPKEKKNTVKLSEASTRKKVREA